MPRHSERNYKTVAISIDPELADRLKRLAFANDASVSAIVTLAVEKYLGAKNDDSISRGLQREGLTLRRSAQ